MNKQEVIIYGNGKIAKVLYYYLKESYNIVAFTVQKKFIKDGFYENIPIIPFEKLEKEIIPQKYKFLIAVGYHKMNLIREKIYNNLKRKGYQFISYIHPSVMIYENSTIGENNVILENVAIQPFVKIGNNNVIWSNVVVAHGVKIDNSNWIASGTIIGGDSIIGSNCFIGLNVSISHNLCVNDFSFIGANTLVIKDIKKGEVIVSKEGERLRIDSKRFIEFTGI